MKAVMRTARAVDNDQPLISADPMFGMNHQIPGIKCADLTQKIVTAGPLCLWP